MQPSLFERNLRGASQPGTAGQQPTKLCTVGEEEEERLSSRRVLRKGAKVEHSFMAAQMHTRNRKWNMQHTHTIGNKLRLTREREKKYFYYLGGYLRHLEEKNLGDSFGRATRTERTSLL